MRKHETHGHGAEGHRSPTYRSWDAMKQRCLNENHQDFKNYGGRGITICARWLLFSNFLEDMGRRPSTQHSIERKDNDKPYEPSNCLWVTAKDQANNRRTNTVLTYRGEQLTKSRLLDRFFPEAKAAWNTRLYERLKKGWSVEDAVETPPPGRGGKHHPDTPISEQVGAP